MHLAQEHPLYTRLQEVRELSSEYLWFSLSLAFPEWYRA